MRYAHEWRGNYYLRGAATVNDPDIEPAFDFTRSHLPRLKRLRSLRHGENNNSFLYEDSSGNKYVVRAKKPHSTTGPLNGERDILRFVFDAGFKFAPKSIYFDEAAGFHVIEYVDGEDIRPFEFDTFQAGLFARQLGQLHEIKFCFYAGWCESNGHATRPPETLEQNLSLYFTGPAAFVAKHCPDTELAGWVAQTVDKYVLHARERPTHPELFVHGDLGGNMRWDGKNLHFIDWERARFLHLNELGYIFVHGQCPPKLRSVIQSAYAEYRGLDAKALADQVAFETELLEVDKVLWPINKFTELTVAGNLESARYRMMAYDALKAWSARPPLKGLD
jgi:aminoglycoside phosphotransferase (APT) family kinase protein